MDANDVKRITVGKNVTELEDGVFADLPNLEEIDFSNCNKDLEIPARCFKGCSKIEYIQFPE